VDDDGQNDTTKEPAVEQKSWLARQLPTPTQRIGAIVCVVLLLSLLFDALFEGNL
jgi:hypothetical protein